MSPYLLTSLVKNPAVRVNVEYETDSYLYLNYVSEKKFRNPYFFR
jgi:hypothetical protein